MRNGARPRESRAGKSKTKGSCERARLAACDHLLLHCGTLRPGETLQIVHDANTDEIASRLAARGAKVTSAVERHRIANLEQHGQEPPTLVAEAMCRADLVIGLTTLSMAHSQARRRACEAGARYLSLPDYSLDLLTHPAVRTDFRARAPVVRNIADIFSKGRSIHVVTSRGTDIHLDISGRTGNCCPGFVDAPGDMGSPPDIEANVSPIETASKGVVVIDGSIPFPGIGLLTDPVTLVIENGHIASFGGDARLVERLETLFAAVQSPKAYVLAECGVGLNRDCELTGAMLTDEGTNGTMHFGFGSNATVGGVNAVPFHLDFVFRDATLTVDGIPVIQSGEVLNDRP